MQVCGAPRELLAGDPLCAPVPFLMSESYIELIRTLHSTDQWTNQVRYRCVDQTQSYHIERL